MHYLLIIECQFVKAARHTLILVSLNVSLHRDGFDTFDSKTPNLIQISNKVHPSEIYL